jgi:hypothetical protein
MRIERILRSKVAWALLGAVALVLSAVALASAAQAIPSGAAPPASHSDGRAAEACANCHAVVPGPGDTPPTVDPGTPPTSGGGDVDEQEVEEADDAVDDVGESVEAPDADEGVGESGDTEIESGDGHGTATQTHEVESEDADDDAAGGGSTDADDHVTVASPSVGRTSRAASASKGSHGHSDGRAVVSTGDGH